MPQGRITVAVGAQDTSISVDATDAADFPAPQFEADLDGEPVIVLAGPPGSGTWTLLRESANAEVVAETLFVVIDNDGLGQTELGIDWKHDTGDADVTVETDGTKAIITAITGAARVVPSLIIPLLGTETRLHWRYPALPAGDNMDSYATARWAETNEYYRARLRVDTAGVVTSRLSKVDSAEVATDLTTNASTGITIAAGEGLWIAMQAYGESPTTIRQKVWKDTDPEPTTWLQSTTDSQAELQDAGWPGFLFNPGASLSSLPYVVELLEVQVRQIQPGTTHPVDSLISSFDEWPLPTAVVVGSGPPTAIAREGSAYVDSETDTFYVRVRGTWRSVALT